MNKVVIIGCGNVGMSYAYALLNQSTAVNELVLIDLNKKRIEGEVMDLNHCLAFAPSKIDIKAGDYNDCKNAKIVVIAAGANQDIGFDGIFLVATNPLDVMTYLTYKYSKLPSNQVIGTGTSLDTSRLRYMLGEKLNMNPKNMHAYVIGEHGDSEFVLWSKALVGTENINKFIERCNNILENSQYKLKSEVRDGKISNIMNIFKGDFLAKVNAEIFTRNIKKYLVKINKEAKSNTIAFIERINTWNKVTAEI